MQQEAGRRRRSAGLLALLLVLCGQWVAPGPGASAERAARPGPSAPADPWRQRAVLTDSMHPLGESVALSAAGDVALVGAPLDADKRGAAYVFTRTRRGWRMVARLVARDGAAGAQFGYVVALSADGETALIDGDINVARGSIYVFARSGAAWRQASELTASRNHSGEKLGPWLALSADGRTAAISAFRGQHPSGVVYVFGRSGGTWRRMARLVASDGAGDDGFANSLAVSGDGTVVLVGAFSKDFGENFGQGAAYVFTCSGGVWRQSSEITVASGASDDNFGTALALSADGATALVGAPNANATSQTAPGAVYVFTRSGARWRVAAKLTPADGVDGDTFGTAVALSADGRAALVGSPRHSGSGYLPDRVYLPGWVYVFAGRGGAWRQDGELRTSVGLPAHTVILPPPTLATFGLSLALDARGATLLVGAGLGLGSGGYIFMQGGH